MNDFTPSQEQRHIIDHPAAPLRIAAGAGTGKTTTIVHRLVASILDGGDPARALGVTFTNKAADELRMRLREAIPPRPDGREVEVATYHGFAAGIIDEFGSRVGHRAATIMDEGHRSELAARVLRTYQGTLLDLTSLPQRRDELLVLASNMRDNLVTADDVRATAPDHPDETWSKRLELVDLVEEFERAKHDLGLVEFGDLLRLAVAIVEDHPDVADDLRSRYDAVLLDEYQDTDPVQRRLLRGVFPEPLSITAVGDTDQTIYEWRGASIDNFDSFPSDFPDRSGAPAVTLPLSVNRRSDRAIIDMANAVKRELPDSSGAASLVPDVGAPAGLLVAAWHRTDHEEAAWIADEIRTRHAAGVPFAEMAVLCRKRDSMRPIADALRSAEVPYTVGSMGELLDVPEVADLVAWLRILAEPTDDAALLRVLMGGRYRLGMGDLAAINRSAAASATASETDTRERSLIDAVLGERAARALPSDGADAITAFSGAYRDLFVRSQAMSVSATIGAVVEALDIWAEVSALPPAHATTTRINISRFLDLADRWRPLDGSYTLSAYLRYLDALAESGRADELDAAEVPVDDAVRILTVHGAKGLEWSEVYLPALSSKVFPSGIQRYYDPIDSAVALPYALRLDGDTMRALDGVTDTKERRRILKRRHDDGEWRLAYVAVTRAKHRLVMSGHAWHRDNKTAKDPSELLDLAFGREDVAIGPFVEDAGDRPDPVIYTPPPDAPDPLFEHGWAHALRSTVRDDAWVDEQYAELTDDADRRKDQLALAFAELAEPTTTEASEAFVTSVTNLVALAECPLKFMWIHHERLPRRPRVSAVRGTEFHRRAELHNLGVVSLDDGLDADDALGSETEDVGDGTPAATIDPWSVFSSSRFFDERPTLAEAPFEIEIDGRRIRGKVDAVYAEEGSWEIVDYKSGRPSTTEAKLVQLEAYAVAATEGALGSTTPNELTVTFAYFGVAPAVEDSHTADEEWVTGARRHVGDLLVVAEEGPWPAAPGPDCRWCDFLHHCDAGKAATASPPT